jgi:hypothetical protein
LRSVTLTHGVIDISLDGLLARMVPESEEISHGVIDFRSNGSIVFHLPVSKDTPHRLIDGSPRSSSERPRRHASIGL